MPLMSKPSTQTHSDANSIDDFRGRKIGRILMKMGKITADQLDVALALQKKDKSQLGIILLEMGLIKKEDIEIARAHQEGMKIITLKEANLSNELKSMVPAEMANAYQILPVEYNQANHTLTVAMKSADNYRAVDDLRLLMGFNVKAVFCAGEELTKRIEQEYGDGEETLASMMAHLAPEDFSDFAAVRGNDLDAAMALAEDNRVKRLVNLILIQAIKEKAADIHIEPFEDELKLRYRIDGVLYEMVPPPKQLAMALVSRLKVMANMNIAERRIPQDGRIELTLGGKPIDLRVAVLPTMWGEAVVMRILDRGNTALSLDTLGFRDEELRTFRQLIGKPNGIVAVTGPTGSGKTTTLYSAMAELNTLEDKICTAEDPVEYDLDGIIQVQVKPDVGLTFAAALRSFLRQDPDIILVGETRDLETARISVQAALTGHLVFTTLHTNDAPTSIARLLDLGLEPFLVTACLEGVLAQRLVRKVCKACREPFAPTERDLMQLKMAVADLEGRKIYKGRGCENCNRSGYLGRMGLYEVMVINDEIRDLILNAASSQKIQRAAMKHGMRTLRQSGILAIYDGHTSIDEVVRETLEEM